MTHVMKTCDTCDAAFLELFLLHCIFSKSIGTVLLAGILQNQIMYSLFGNLVGNTS